MNFLFFGELPPHSSNGISRANKFYLEVAKTVASNHYVVIDYPHKNIIGIFTSVLSAIRFMVYSVLAPKPLVVYFTLSQGNLGVVKSLVLATVARCSGAELIIHLHRGDLLECCIGYKYYIYRFILKCARNIICISKTQRQELHQISDTLFNKSVVCSNPFPHRDQLLSVYNQRRLQEPGSRSMVFVGPLTLAKGVRCLLSQYIYCILKDQNATLGRLTIAGRSVEKHITMIVDCLNKSEILTFIESPSFCDIPSILQEHAILVLPSLTEGLPYLAIEALVSGMWVFISKVGYVAEIFGDSYPLYIDPLDKTSLFSLLSRIDSLSYIENSYIQAARQSALNYIRDNSGDRFRALLVQ